MSSGRAALSLSPASALRRIPAVFLADWALVLLVQILNHNSAAAVALTLAACGGTVLYFLLRKPTISTHRFGRRAWVAALLFIALIQALYCGIGMRRGDILDIGATTLRAGEVMLQGGNPYATPLDRDARDLMRSVMPPDRADRYAGYKYLPLMAAAYAPLGRPFGPRGLIATNLLAMVALLAALHRLVRAAGPADAARWAVLFLGTVPLAIFQLYAKGATDIAPVVPLVLAAAAAERRPGTGGLLVGLSLAMKLVPAVLLVPLFLPRGATARGRYLVGFAAGCVPALVYLARAWRPFADNILFFNLLRPVDPTSWLAGLGAGAAQAAQLVFAALWLAAAIFCVLRPPPLVERAGLAALVLIGALLAGPGMHQNYMLWWLPFFAATVGWSLAPSNPWARSAPRAPAPGRPRLPA